MTLLIPYLFDFEKEITESSDPEGVLKFWQKVAWEVETCMEAEQMFPDMQICPVCLQRALDGQVGHLPRKAIEH